MPAAPEAAAPASGDRLDREVDVIVLGMGPGGEGVAGRLLDAGTEVAAVEAELVGGECPYWGCVPSKMMIRASDLLAEARRVPGVAGDASVEPDFAPVARRIRAEATDDWDDTAAADRFTGKGGILLRGRGRFVDRTTVEVTAADGSTQRVRARRGVVVATGTKASVPPVPGLADVPYWTNREVVTVTEPPRSLVVLGGGAIGVELAQVFARFGTSVTVVEVADRLVANEEPEAGALLARVLTREGLDVRTGASVTAVEHDGTEFMLTVDGAPVRAERLLVAAGRTVDLAALDVGAAGLDPDAKSLAVDEHLRVAPGIWAVGDVTGRGAFTHVATYQAPIAVASILGEDHRPADYRALTRVTFTDPEIGSVGLTEAAAREQGIAVRTGTMDVSKTARGWIHQVGNDGLIKLVEDTDRGVLVGATSMGPWGGEVLGALAVAVHAEVPVAELRAMIWAYPTFHRGIEDALVRLEAS